MPTIATRSLIPLLAMVLSFSALDGPSRNSCAPPARCRGVGTSSRDADRRRSEGRRDREASRDDVPAPLHRAGGAQLFLEGPSRALKERIMASNGIKDRVAIVGMGCTPFGEHWDKGPEDLLVDAATEAYRSAGIDSEQVDAYWLGTMASGFSGLLLSEALKIPYKPVTRLENMCATGSEAIRNAAYAVACGAYDLVMAIGVEKLKDSR